MLTFTAAHLTHEHNNDTYTVITHSTALPYAHRFITYDSRVPTGIEIVRIHPTGSDNIAEAFFTFAGAPFDITETREDQIAPSRTTIPTLWHDIATLLMQNPHTPIYVTPVTYLLHTPSWETRNLGASAHIAVETALHVADWLGDRPVLITDSLMLTNSGGARLEPDTLTGLRWHTNPRLHNTTRTFTPSSDCPDRVLAVSRNRRVDAQQDAVASLRA